MFTNGPSNALRSIHADTYTTLKVLLPQGVVQEEALALGSAKYGLGAFSKLVQSNSTTVSTTGLHRKGPPAVYKLLLHKGSSG